MKAIRLGIAMCCLLFGDTVAMAELADPETKFGARNSVQQMSLSPDGTKIVYISPAGGAKSVAMVATLGGGEPQPVAQTDGAPWNLSWCDWASNVRLVCSLYGIESENGFLLPYTRLLAMDINGGNLIKLGQSSKEETQYRRQFDGSIIDWHSSDNGKLLMSRNYVPERASSLKLASSEKGLGVDEVDSTTGKSERRESPREGVRAYISDGKGQVRLMSTYDSSLSSGDLLGMTRFFYRKINSRDWIPFSVHSEERPGLIPFAVDSAENVAFAYNKKNGRDVLYKISLDGSLSLSLIYDQGSVDIDDSITLGRSGRVVGVQVITDRRESIYFDAGLKKIAESLKYALPSLPLIEFVGASRNELKILIHASSDVDPGRYYLFDKERRNLSEIMLSRPMLEGAELSEVKSIRYKSSDGTEIPGYLTLPRGSKGKNLPAIVMPHGGPAARDEWGFDWMVQYYATMGFAVLQPNFRGSSGYGEDWFVGNGFKSWNIAIGDVNAGGKWLVDQGIANPNKLAIVGWSYGGYAALQSNVLAPDLFKAIVAIAPVTDLQMLVDDSQNYTNSRLTREYVGKGPHVVAGSPLRNIGAFKAPVLMFSGDRDLNVNIRHARSMDKAMRAASKSSLLVVYKGLDHNLIDSNVRAQMLRQSAEFLREKMGE
jgi:dipeptidyl aminopeptidase/acylaminoacyl peptidase